MKEKSDLVRRLAMDVLGGSFLRMAKLLADVQEFSPDDFNAVAEILGVSRRQAYYLAKIHRAYHGLGVDEGQLVNIGWTKLQILADHINEDNCEVLLNMAETSTVRELIMVMRDEMPIDGTRCVILYLEPAQYEIFSKAVLAHGGQLLSGGLSGKEAALTKALEKTV